MRENIKLFITTNGWQVVGELLSAENNEYMVDKPVNIVQHPDPAMNGKLVFMPYLQLSTEEMCIFKADHIMHVLTPVDALINDWDKQFGSGLDIPQQEIILG